MRARNLLTCPCCGLAVAACPGAATVRIETRVRVVIVSHCIELRRTSNTGKLARRVLSRSELRVRGEWGHPSEPVTANRKLLLFPEEGARELEPSDALPEDTVLIVPDGTWAQARRMVRRDPVVQGAEPVSLPAGSPSRYRLRNGVGEGMLCTYEAVARAMGILEGPEVERAMDEVFDRFVRTMLGTRGHGSGAVTPDALGIDPWRVAKTRS
jgi:DTW domain-containing protein YfiP